MQWKYYFKLMVDIWQLLMKSVAIDIQCVPHTISWVHKIDSTFQSSCIYMELYAWILANRTWGAGNDSTTARRGPKPACLMLHLLSLHSLASWMAACSWEFQGSSGGTDRTTRGKDSDSLSHHWKENSPGEPLNLAITMNYLYKHSYSCSNRFWDSWTLSKCREGVMF